MVDIEGEREPVSFWMGNFIQLKANKSWGSDEIPADVYKNGAGAYYAMIARLFNLKLS